MPSGWRSMFVRTLDELRAAGHEKVVAGGTARTVRMLTAADSMGFSLSDVTLDADKQNVLWSKDRAIQGFRAAADAQPAMAQSTSAPPSRVAVRGTSFRTSHTHTGASTNSSSMRNVISALGTCRLV